MASSRDNDVESANSEEDENCLPQEGVIYVETVGQVWTSKFVLGQLLFNVLASAVGPLATFYLLFGVLSQGPYEWYSGPLLGVVAGSLAGSPILIFALMPVGLPEAVAYGWFPKITEKSLIESQSWLSSPLMLRILKCPWSTQRNLAIGLLTGVVLVPIALLVARFVFGPTLPTWTLIWCNVVYEVVLSVPVLLIGLVGYALEPNLDATLERMSDHPHWAIRLLRRTCASLRMTVSPY